ncbi:hypothetical protein BD289DRAFT_158632 [Coniella lustricola]|uniref:Uncharacterized protein n=1 Tax=Coniella lustricola TaxID=2025994 RepID=A0A2T3AEL7_9PEZI|nr:hypothetical protein BD289DRAFT_158632 [Coniella lustricola]
MRAGPSLPYPWYTTYRTASHDNPEKRKSHMHEHGESCLLDPGWQSTTGLRAEWDNKNQRSVDEACSDGTACSKGRAYCPHPQWSVHQTRLATWLDRQPHSDIVWHKNQVVIFTQDIGAALQPIHENAVTPLIVALECARPRTNHVDVRQSPSGSRHSMAQLSRAAYLKASTLDFHLTLENNGNKAIHLCHNAVF